MARMPAILFIVIKSGLNIMLTLRKANERGHTHTDWLDSYHSFSFAEYHDPKFMRFGCLRVINDDYIKPAAGFGMHPHRDMEIITYMLEGELAHEDSMGNGAVLHQGDVQRMSAGTGIMHSEFNPSDKVSTHLLQIWIFPEFQDLMPAYEQVHIKSTEKINQLRLIASQEGKNGALTIHQDALIFAGNFNNEMKHEYEIKSNRQIYLHMAGGTLEVNGFPLANGDGLMFVDEKKVIMENAKNAEVMLFDLPY
jgi:redox-sensitive bicupin YhaK (pirin superfamily)